MARITSAVQRKKRHKKILDQAKGYRGARSKLFKTAKEAVEKALQYSYRDRKKRKNDFRRLWIIRINAASRLHGLKYSSFVSGLSKAGVTLDRKVLADIAFSDPKGFGVVAKIAKEA